jgi:hypothetical protein
VLKFERKFRRLKVNDLYCSPSIVQMIKSRRWAGHVAGMGMRTGVYSILVGKPEGNNHLGNPCVDGRIILRWICRKWDVGYGLDRAGSG